MSFPFLDVFVVTIKLFYVVKEEKTVIHFNIYFGDSVDCALKHFLEEKKIERNNNTIQFSRSWLYIVKNTMKTLLHRHLVNIFVCIQIPENKKNYVTDVVKLLLLV